MSETPTRPWYSFRWTILLWVFVPLALITTSDLLYALNSRFPANPFVDAVTISYGVAFWGLILYLFVKGVRRFIGYCRTGDV